MTLHIRLATAADQVIWDQYVVRHSQATPYHRFAWLQSIRAAYQHESVSLLALQDKRVVGIMPCIKMKAPFRRLSFCALPYCDIGGALSDSQIIKDQLFTKALGGLRQAGGCKLDYRDNALMQNEAGMVGQKVRMLLPLPDTSEQLMAEFKSKLRSQIRKSEKNGLTCIIANDKKQIEDFYNIFAINMRKLGSPVHSKKWFEALFNYYEDNIVLSVVYINTVAVGAGITLKNGTKVSIPWASTVAEYNKLAPNMMLYWSLLQHACDTSCTEFDFGRSTYGEGTYKFKRQWGAQPHPLLWRDLTNTELENEQNTESTDLKPGKLRPLVEDVWSRLPMGVTTILGPLIRKHISL
ncbi:MAG: FemAB-related protein (PEP-CTERM system-associated) [Paraglaciecola sp.]|jgi:FemAB-related protein (PEP-CTERM system-associated)